MTAEKQFLSHQISQSELIGLLSDRTFGFLRKGMPPPKGFSTWGWWCVMKTQRLLLERDGPEHMIPEHVEWLRKRFPSV